MDIRTEQYMESKKYFKIDLLQIYNADYARGIVSVNASMFHEITMPIKEDDYYEYEPR